MRLIQFVCSAASEIKLSCVLCPKRVEYNNKIPDRYVSCIDSNAPKGSSGSTRSSLISVVPCWSFLLTRSGQVNAGTWPQSPAEHGLDDPSLRLITSQRVPSTWSDISFAAFQARGKRTSSMR